MSEILDKFKELHYGLEVWQDATLLRESLPEFNKLEEQIERALKFFEHGKKLNERDIDMGDWTDNALEIIND